MLKIVANVSKKVPIPGIDYSSQSYSAGVEVEVADAASPQEIENRVHEIYGLLERTIDTEIAIQHPGSPAPQPQPPVNRIATYVKPGGNGKSNGNGRHATEAQIKAIYAISKSISLTRDGLLDLISREFKAGKVEDLTVKEASRIIEELKATQEAQARDNR